MKKLVTLLFAFVIASCAWSQKRYNGFYSSEMPSLKVTSEMQARLDHLMGKDKISTKKAAPRRNAAPQDWIYPTSEPSTPYGGGTGTQEDPYIIGTAQHLANLAYMVNNGTNYSGYYFKMKNDIVLNENVLASDGSLNSGSFNSWIPIGGYYHTDYEITTDIGYDNNPFCGTFDGNGHKVSGIYFDDTSYHSVGLFGSTIGATIKNLGIEDCFIYAQKDVAGISGSAIDVNISNCYNTGTVIAHSFCCGGIIGKKYSDSDPESPVSSVTACYNSGYIVTLSGNCAGGICGNFMNGLISYCYNIGKVSSAYSAVAGIAYGDGLFSISNCHNTGIITYGADSHNGSISGSGTAENSYYLAGTCDVLGAGMEKSSSDFINGTVLSLLDPSGNHFIQGENGYPVLRGVGEGIIEDPNKTTTSPTAGTGTVKSTLPYNTDSKYSTTQMVYTPSEVTSGKGVITMIAFNVANPGPNTPSELEVYMAHRTKRIASAASAIASDKLTLVYSGTPRLASSSGWENIILDTPFEYDGKSYLAVVVCRKSSSTSGNAYYITKQTSGYTLYRTSNTESNYGDVTGEAGYTATRNRPNIQFTKVVIDPIGISLSYEKTSIFVGKTRTLKATIIPDNAHNKTITWTSSDPEIATVSSKGVVTANNLGTATITATTSNGKSATCLVTVKQPVTDIEISDEAVSLWVDEKKTLTATAIPATANKTSVTWSSSDTNVATISSKGTITAKGAGTATITCKAADGSGVSKTCEVTVNQQVTSIELSATTATIWVGKTKKLTATANPTTALNTAVTWSSSDTQVATVSSKGTITAVGKGECTIICEAADGYGAKTECAVTVKQQVTAIDLGYEDLTITAGTTKTLNPTIYPENASVQKVSWKSKNTSIATVTSAGVVKAITPGTVEIICTATDGFKKADTITVNVVPLKITDSKPAIAEATYGIGGISYTRTVTEGKYASFCMPYAVDLSEYTDEFSMVYTPMDVALHRSSGLVVISLKKMSLTETIPAGQPFIAYVAKSGDVDITNSSNVTVSSSLKEPETRSLEVYDYGTYFITYNPDIEVKISGTYVKLTGLDNTNNFVFYTSGKISGSTSVSPFRLHIMKNDERSNAKITDIQFAFDEDEMATGIETIVNEGSGDDRIYNLKGQRINRSNAQKGIYINKGRKYVK